MLFLKKPKKIILTLIGLIIFLFIVFLNREISLDHFINLNYWHLMLAIVLMYLSMILAAGRWGWIINTLEKRKVIPYRKYFFYFSLGAMLGSFFGQEVSVFTTRTGTMMMEKVSPKNIVSAYLIDKFLNTINLLSILFISALYFLNLIEVKVAAVLFLLTIVLVYSIFSLTKIDFTSLIIFLKKIVTRLSKYLTFLKIPSDNPITEKDQFALSSSVFKKLYLLSVVKFLLLALSIFFIFKALNLNIHILQVILALPVAELSLVFAFTPGGLGILEAGWFILLKIIGFLPVEINTFLIGFRVISLFSIVLITFINYLLFLTTNKKYEDLPLRQRPTS